VYIHAVIIKKQFAISAVCVTAALLALYMTPLQSQKNYSYIGMSECKKCHGTDSLGNQIKVWDSNPHSMAYRNLRTEKGVKIGEKYKIKTPSESLQCLKCHTTGGGSEPKTATEGVGCEACHGPASGYGELSNHGAFANKEKDYQTAVSHGMYKTLGYEGIKLREKMCKRCHTNDRLCAPEDIVERKKQELSLSVIADFIFRHPLR
jgi:Cytochrome c554 and c-prime